MRRYSSRTPLTTRSSYSELGVERLTNVLGRHAEMFRARDNPGNALGETMHRGSRCANLCALRRAKRWTLARECLAGPSTAQTQRLTDTQRCGDSQSARLRASFPPLVVSANFSEVPEYHMPSVKIPHAEARGKVRCPEQCAKKRPSLAPGLGEKPTRWPPFSRKSQRL